jgi:ABC-type lipoprotein export system ATPase subunit
VHDVSIDFPVGQLHAVTGPVRSGKTLLLHLLGLLDEPDFGGVELFGEAVSPAPEELRREIRNAIFGYLFASPCLLPAFTVAENVAMPLFRVAEIDERAARQRVAEVLSRLDLEPFANTPCGNLGPGTQFLVALARALIHRPRVLLLLEPGRPDILVPHVRALVDDLGMTAIWSGLPGDWIDACDQETRLDNGCVVAPTAS